MILGSEVANGQVGHRMRPRPGNLGREKPDGEAHGLGLICQDSFVIQTGLDGHSLARLSCCSPRPMDSFTAT